MSEDPRASAARGLAALLRSGMSPVAALQRWPREAPTEVRAEVTSTAARVALGCPAPRALAPIEVAWGTDGRSLSSCFLTSMESGGDLAAMLDDLAASIDGTSGRKRNARAASAGASLSGRLILVVPIVLLVAGAMTRGGIDAGDSSGVFLGAVLGGLGSFWIVRLTPKPPPDDDLAAACDVMRRALVAGVSVRGALSAAAAQGPDGTRAALERAGAMIDLGFTPRRALERAGLPELSDRLGDAFTLGVPLSDSLHSLARLRRAEASLEFETRLRRAPVLMALPLSLCLLPSFFLIGFAPLLKAL